MRDLIFFAGGQNANKTTKIRSFVRSFVYCITSFHHNFCCFFLCFFLLFFIEEDQFVDTGANAFNIMKCRKIFQYAHKILVSIAKDRKHDGSQSILGYLVSVESEDMIRHRKKFQLLERNCRFLQWESHASHVKIKNKEERNGNHKVRRTLFRKFFNFVFKH